MQILNDTWCVPDGDRVIKEKILFTSNHKVYSNGEKVNPNNINLYYEHKVREAVLNETTEFGAFIDVGANVGIWSRPLASIFKKVYAFEPVETNIECLNKNIEALDNIEVYDNALSDRNGHANLYMGNTSNCGNNKVTYECKMKKKHFGAEDLIPVRTLDSYEFENVGLIKIDTQGHELPIIQGSVETLKKNKPTIIFEVNKKKDVCCDILESLGATRMVLLNKCLISYFWK